MSIPHRTPLEDTLSDVLEKAIKGHVLDGRIIMGSEAMWQLQSRINKANDVTHEELGQIASSLNLDLESLIAIRKDPYACEPALPSGCYKVESPFRNWSVNAYLIQIPDTQTCLIFDACLREAKSS